MLRALDAIRPASVLTQLEIPFAVVERVAWWSRANSARFVLNPSPVRSRPRALLSLCDPLIVNAWEAMAILHSADTESVNTQQAAKDLAVRTASIVVTDGSRGAWMGSVQGGVTLIAGKDVLVRDTTGAGD